MIFSILIFSILFFFYSSVHSKLLVSLEIVVPEIVKITLQDSSKTKVKHTLEIPANKFNFSKVAG